MPPGPWSGPGPARRASCSRRRWSARSLGAVAPSVGSWPASCAHKVMQCSPTVGGGRATAQATGSGPPKAPYGDEHEPGPQLRHPVLAGVYQVPPGLVAEAVELLEHLCPVAIESVGGQPAHVLQQTARGPISSTRRSAWGNRSRSSSWPSCLPAMENGGHGTPPENRSMPAYPRPSTLWTSSSMTFHSEPRFRRSVSQASGSSSTAASWRNPACSSPSDCPPAPGADLQAGQFTHGSSSSASCLIVPMAPTAGACPTPINTY